MDVFESGAGKPVLMKMVKAIQDKKDYLGEVDGLIGDGDHGMNMNKGFTVFAKRFGEKEFDLADGLGGLGSILFNEIGGSMGPIYGTVLMAMAESTEGKAVLRVSDLADMLGAGLKDLQELVDARVGDKTLVDTLTPAVESLEESARRKDPMRVSLENMKEAARRGRDSTKDMTAKFGRSSRLGERSRGVLDAGAVSCCVLLEGLADGILETIKEGPDGERS